MGEQNGENVHSTNVLNALRGCITIGSIKTQPILTTVVLSLCLSVHCAPHKKRMNRSRYHLGNGLVGPRNHVLGGV